MGDPGRLSPDDSDRLSDEKLRLVCKSGEGCMANRLNTDRRRSCVFSFLGFLVLLIILLL